MILWLLLLNVTGVKKRRKIDGFTKKLIPEFEVKSKIGNIFVNEQKLEEYSVNVYEIDPYFYGHHEEKKQADKNGREYILFRIHVYFTNL